MNARNTRLTIAVAIVAVAATLGGRRMFASDHQDTPEVELNPRMDINDVYAFPGSSSDRVALIMTTSSPIVGSNASFDPNLLYQFKIDNTGDAKEDLVIQVTFDEGTGASQQVTVRGPVAPVSGFSGSNMSKLVNASNTVTGAVGTTLGTATGIQVFTGLRRDPFFIDLEQFFKILPDRRPSTGPLATPLTATASAFRNPGVDLLGSLNANALAIVVEVPKTMLTTATDAGAKLGIWATISR